jgi:hypothetical protein
VISIDIIGVLPPRIDFHADNSSNSRIPGLPFTALTNTSSEMDAVRVKWLHLYAPTN